MNTHTYPVISPERQTQIGLQGLVPHLFEARAARAAHDEWPAMRTRFGANSSNLFRLLLALYRRHYDFFYHSESVARRAARMWLARPADLKALDKDAASPQVRSSKSCELQIADWDRGRELALRV